MTAERDTRFKTLEPAGFEWDNLKSQANLKKHNIAFEEASEIFYSPIIAWRSPRNNEERWIAIGEANGRIISVIFTHRSELIRIISARHPRPNEERAYRNATMGRSPQGKD
ncbi:BrnT family toxin [Tardiphaga sp. 804_B3_N1_9]|uniref:BrnT family toxin n=1 Tax=Tardiphaga robiniae TaxID=943830 RepID=A0A7G6U728_9BRAD|nr:BrnT family toxin [Tardiphaga robiniae]NUU44228.1 BrnT family toxin [Tardiphaga robiniae]QND74810.1 BrnT family toxin [Tardiphaga robiniae]